MAKWMRLSGLMLTAVWAIGCGEETKTEKPTNPKADAGVTDTTGGDTGGEDASVEDTSADTGADTTIEEICKNDADCSTALTVAVCKKAACVNQKCVIKDDDDGKSCDDGEACTEADQCKNGACAGVDKKCNDSNPCTADSCDPGTGECKAVPKPGNCDDLQQCTTDDKCVDGKCEGTQDPACGCTADADCEKQEDADLCNGTLTCKDSKCVVKAGSEVTCDASSAGSCEVIACEKSSGECKTAPKDEGTQCDDGDHCTKDDKCKAGACKGATVLCDDKNPCTTDGCDKDKGCVYPANADACNDGDLCTSDDKCAEGKCTGTKNPDCSACATDADCAKFENGDLCDGVYACVEAACVVKVGSEVKCDASGDACKLIQCVPATGLCETTDALTGSPCDDASVCTEGDHCEAGACVAGAPIKCKDNKACTKDSCDAVNGCVYAPLDGGDCGDGNSCTDQDTCVAGVCQGTPIPGCGEGECQDDASCKASEDGDLCNGTLVCKDKKCVVDPETVVTCDTEGVNSCIKVSCVPGNGKCIKSQLDDGVECDDLNACTEKDRCSSGVCKGKPVSCNDAKLCTDDSCDPDAGCVHSFNDSPCDDGNVCTDNDQCKQGACAGTPMPSDECTCSSDADCKQDEDLCNGNLVCKGSKCVVDPATLVTCEAIPDECSNNVCDPKTGQCGAVSANDGKPCNDSDACTTADACQAGKCVGAEAAPCDDKNPCTDDVCDPDFGCVATPNAAGCDDGDACTLGDFCDLGSCQPGPDQSPDCTGNCVSKWTMYCGSFDSWQTTNSDSTNVITKYSCNETDTFSGPEYTYLYTAPYDGTLTATLSNDSILMDVMILEQSDSGCDPALCLATGYTTASVAVKKGRNYYIVVDSIAEFAGKYTIETTCTPAHELSCTDGVDDDADGATDCDDSDCTGDMACIPPTCVSDYTLSCGSQDNWANYNSGSTDNVEGYSCNGYSYQGPEYTYTFDAPVTGPVTVTLSNEVAETDVLVLTDADGLCSSDKCVAYGLSSVTFDATAGQRYYIVVDGYQDAQGSYTLDVTCPPEVPTCTPPQEKALACGESVTRNTTDADFSANAVVTYGCNGYNYSGSEIATTFVAPYSGKATVSLTDTADPDLDLLVVPASNAVCDPFACLAYSIGGSEFTFDMVEGQTYYLVVDGYNGAEGDFTLNLACLDPNPEICDNDTDDDGDGTTDCEDADCFGSSGACQPSCTPDFNLYCSEDSDSWGTDNSGATNVIDHYSCNGDLYSGPEYTYTYVAEADGPITVSLSNEPGDGDLDLMVIEEKGLGCNPASCLTTAFTSVSFDAVAGQTYYIVVDGYNGEVGDYDLAFSCGN